MTFKVLFLFTLVAHLPIDDDSAKQLSTTKLSLKI